MGADLISILAAFFVAAASPGPATLGCAAVAASEGPRAGRVFAFGLAVGLAVWGVLAALGLGAVLAASAWALIVLKVLGALYLFWLALGVLRGGAVALGPRRPGRYFRQGLLLNLSNPKAVFAWAAALAMGLGPEAGWVGVALATGICALLGLAIYLAWAFLFSRSAVRLGYQAARGWVNAAVALGFAVAGGGLLRSAFVR